MTLAMLQNCDPYFRVIKNLVSNETKQDLLGLAEMPNAFVDISYKISFFKFPSRLQPFTEHLNCACQMLRVNEPDSVIHKDKNRHNEFDGTYIPRQTVISFSLTENCGVTHFYDDDKNFVCEADYGGHGAILNTGDHYHNVHFTPDDNTRIVFQMCFEESYEDVVSFYENRYKDIII